LERLILHVDVNNAFLSWTAVDRLEKGETLDIRTVPSVIGGDEAKRHGIVLAKSVPAKKLGINTPDPIYFAKKKCRDLLVFPADFAVYGKYSWALFRLLSEYTDKIERFSIDECFMDMTGCLMGKKSIEEVAKEISNRVSEELKFTVNIGISNNKILAKMASDFEKPNKIHTLYPHEIQEKMWHLPVGELFMVGKRSVGKLNAMKIHTIGDLARFDHKLIMKKFGKFGDVMWRNANGLDNSEVVHKRPRPKGIGNETTLPKDISDYDKLCECLLPLTEQTMYRLRKENMSATVINVKIKTADFAEYSHQRKIPEATDSTKEVYEIAKELLREVLKGRNVRLIGVRVDGLVENNQVQLSIFDTPNKEKQKKIDKTLDDIRAKYGYDSIGLSGKLKC